MSRNFGTLGKKLLGRLSIIKIQWQRSDSQIWPQSDIQLGPTFSFWNFIIRTTFFNPLPSFHTRASLAIS